MNYKDRIDLHFEVHVHNLSNVMLGSLQCSLSREVSCRQQYVATRYASITINMHPGPHRKGSRSLI